MKFSENRPVAWIVLVVSVLISIVLFGGLGLRQEREAAETAFYDGGGDAYFSLNAYIGRRAEAASKLAALGLAGFGADDADAKALEGALRAVSEASNPDAKIIADRQLTDAADKLYARIAASENISAADKQDARLLYADLTDAAGKMRSDEYSARAQMFNKLLGGFPASILRGLFGISPLEVIV